MTVLAEGRELHHQVADELHWLGPEQGHEVSAQ